MINKGLSTLYGAIFESDIIYLNKNLKSNRVFLELVVLYTNTLKNSKMKTLLFSLFTLLILASCTVDTVSQDELLQQELLSLSEASKSSNKSGSYEDDDDSYEDESSDNDSNEAEEGNENENESEDDSDPNEDSEDHNESGEESDTDGTDDDDSSSSSSDNDSSDNDSSDENSSNDSSSDEDSSNDSDSDSSQNTQGFSATVLSNIQTYVNTNHSGQTIIKMEQETNYIEVDLSNGIEIYFDNNGNFMRYDN